MAKSMNGQSSLFDRMNFEGSPSATSSPVLEDGATPLDSLDGLTSANAGRFLVPARDFHRRREADKLRWICGPNSGASSLQVALASSLANRLPRLEIGSMASAMTWNPWVMRSGRRFCRLSLSVQIMREHGFILLATPTATANQAAASMHKWPGCRGIVVTPAMWASRMGFPLTWLRCLDLATRSSRKSRKSSSKPI